MNRHFISSRASRGSKSGIFLKKLLKEIAEAQTRNFSEVSASKFATKNIEANFSGIKIAWNSYTKA